MQPGRLIGFQSLTEMELAIEIQYCRETTQASRNTDSKGLNSGLSTFSTTGNFGLVLGASCINDISGGKFDTQMFELIGRRKVPFILMHCRGDFNSMHHGQEYINIEVEIARELQELIVKARENGIVDLIVDPGFGFSKNVTQNFELLRKLRYFEILDCPILAGLSRKSMIYKTIEKEPDQALNGTTALNMVALIQGAHILRVHDVAEAKETIQLFEKLCLQE